MVHLWRMAMVVGRVDDLVDEVAVLAQREFRIDARDGLIEQLEGIRCPSTAVAREKPFPWSVTSAITEPSRCASRTTAESDPECLRAFDSAS